MSNIALTLLLWVKVLFLPKNAEFLQKHAEICKIKEVLVLKGIFSKTAYVCVLAYQISSLISIIVTSFKQGVILPPTHTSKRTLKKPTQIRVKKQELIIDDFPKKIKRNKTIPKLLLVWLKAWETKVSVDVWKLCFSSSSTR